MSRFQVKKVAVLGAGVMGAQIAAHLVNVKVPVVLFDLPAKEGPKNGIVTKAVEGLKKLKPSPLGVAMAQLDGVSNTTAFMNVAGGVDGLLSFFYSTPTDVIGAVKAYSGLNGTGTLLGTFDLTANTSDYSNWTAANFTFSGTALSFDLSATANVAGVDNISAVPEPTSLALAACSLAIMGVSLRRRAK